MPLVRTSTLLLLLVVVVACSGPDTVVTSTPNPTATPTEPVAAATQAEPAISTSTPEPVAPTRAPTALPTRTSTTLPAQPPASTATATNPPATETPTPTPTEAPDTPTPEATVPRVEPTATGGQTSDGEDPVAEIDALLEGRQGLYEVVVIGPDGEPVYAHNSDEPVQAASLYKLLVMVETFRQLEDGVIALDDPITLHQGFFKEAGFDDPFDASYIGTEVTVEELLRPMVSLSSNVAAFALLDLVGNTNVNATVAGLGLTASEIRWTPALQSSSVADAPAFGQATYAGMVQPAPTEPPPSADEAFNVTSAADMALLFRLLVEGRVVSPEASEAMLALLAEQVVNDRLPALLPADAVVAHKTGNIDNVIHDAGVIYTPAGPAVVAVLTADALEWEAVEFMQALALLAYERGAR